MASCRIAQECGPDVAEDWGNKKEKADLWACLVLRNIPGGGLGTFAGKLTALPFCESAYQDEDFTDNARGRFCPRSQKCEDRCAPLFNEPNPPPGPFF